MGVYAKEKDAMRFYWLHRQWAFYKKGGELVADDYTSKPCTTLTEAAEMFLAQYVRLTVEKDYELADFDFLDQDLERLVREGITHEDDALKQPKPTPNTADSLASRFKQDQEKREKNTKW